MKELLVSAIGLVFLLTLVFLLALTLPASCPPKTAADLPVDSHELIALCAPRPCFISYGMVEHGDAKWVDAHGSFMAGVPLARCTSSWASRTSAPLPTGDPSAAVHPG